MAKVVATEDGFTVKAGDVVGEVSDDAEAVTPGFKIVRDEKPAPEAKAAPAADAENKDGEG